MIFYEFFSHVAVVSDNDGSAFITKAEFDSLKNNFQAQIDNYNTSIDSKIDGAIAAYLAGIEISSKATLEPVIGSSYVLRSNDILLKSAVRDKISGKLSITGGCLNTGGDASSYGLLVGVTEYTWPASEGEGATFVVSQWGTNKLVWIGWCQSMITMSGTSFGYYDPNGMWNINQNIYGPVFSGGVHRFSGDLNTHADTALFSCCAGVHYMFAFTCPASDFQFSHTVGESLDFNYLCSTEATPIWGRIRKEGDLWDFNYDYLETGAYPLLSNSADNKLGATVRQWCYRRDQYLRSQRYEWKVQNTLTAFCDVNTKSTGGGYEMADTCGNLAHGFGSNGDSYRKKQPNFGYYHPSSITLDSAYNKFNSLAELGYETAADARATIDSGYAYVPVTAGIPIVVTKAGTLDIEYDVKKLDISGNSYKTSGYTLIDYTGYGKIIASDKPFTSASDITGTHTKISENSQTWSNPVVKQKIEVSEPCTIWIKWFSTNSSGTIQTAEGDQFELKVTKIELTTK